MSSISGLGLREKAKGLRGGGGSSTTSSSSKSGGTVSKLMNRGKTEPQHDPRSHVSAPLSTLKDPSSFAPPPKRVGAAGYTPSSPSTARITDGNDGPLTPAEYRQKKKAAEEEALREEGLERAPRIPYRVDTSGVNTANLPPPPVRRDGADGRSTPVERAPPVSAKPKPKPGLPPRLPPRQNSFPTEHTPSPPPTYGTAVAEARPERGILNQGSLSRLGAAGVSVPGFGINPSSKPSLSSRTGSPARTESPSSPAAPPPSQLNELQSRFSRMATSHPSSESPAAVPSKGTTWAEKQAALKTASAFQKDPSSLSLSDARSAASTANNFRQRHGEQVTSGLSAANAANQKYGLANKAAAAYGGSGPGTPVDEGPIVMHDNTGVAAAVAAKKKPPPPAPKKKPAALAGMGVADGGPPPIPMASKPTF